MVFVMSRDLFNLAGCYLEPATVYAWTFIFFFFFFLTSCMHWSWSRLQFSASVKLDGEGWWSHVFIDVFEQFFLEHRSLLFLSHICFFCELVTNTSSSGGCARMHVPPATNPILHGNGGYPQMHFSSPLYNIPLHSVSCLNKLDWCFCCCKIMRYNDFVYSSIFEILICSCTQSQQLCWSVKLYTMIMSCGDSKVLHSDNKGMYFLRSVAMILAKIRC